jgi:ABC-type sulfate/molybdate transport systems ATPase subunit
VLDAHIVKARPRFTVDVTVRVGPGEACGLFGVSGSGKSTVLACIAGAEEPDGGHVTLGAGPVFPPAMPLHRRQLGYLTQDANLFPHLHVGDNVEFGLTNGLRDANASWVAELRERLQLEPIWRAPAHAISGGQARRVALARMLARKPPVVLLDEPFSGLDRHLVRELVAAIVEWQKELGFTMLVVGHESDVLARLCPRAIAIEDGRAVQDASWDELRTTPATPLLSQLLAPL